MLISLVGATDSAIQIPVPGHEVHPLTRQFPAWTRHRAVLGHTGYLLGNGDGGGDQIRTNQGGKLGQAPGGSYSCVLNSEPVMGGSTSSSQGSEPEVGGTQHTLL